jgi:hypothetical protein
MFSLLALVVALGTASETPIVCNLRALTPAEHIRHAATGYRLKAAVINVVEVEGGYRLTLSADFPASDLLQWVEAEQRCCPFLDFDVRLERDNGRRSLQLTGREGVKEFLAREIAAVRASAGMAPPAHR